jgi:hypothetical protein
MEEIRHIKKEIRKTRDVEKINDILIKISKEPNEYTLSLIDFLFESLDSNQLNKIKINLVFLIGEISQIVKLNLKYIDFLIKSYYESDRWVRNEILQALYKIVKTGFYLSSINEVLESALKEDYEPIKENSLNVLELYENLENSSLKSVMLVLSSKNTYLTIPALKILKKNISNEEKLFKFLNYNNNYKLLDKNIIRTLLVEYFTTTTQLESFQEKIMKSEWEKEIKNILSSEIKILEKIFLQVRI